MAKEKEKEKEREKDTERERERERQWAGPKFHSLLSAHHLISAYFITTESDKCMCLLTRLYGNCSHAGQVHNRH